MESFLEKEKYRAEIYRLISALMCEPDESIISDESIYRILDVSMSNLLNLDFNFTKEVEKSLKDVDIEDLLIEHSRLFVGPFKIIAPPYSSLYFGEEILMGDTTVWVKNFYESLGLEFDKSLKDTPDNVVVETEFMYNIIFNEINSLENDNIGKAKFYWEKQVEFLEKHYAIWVPQMCDKVTKNTKYDYYKLLYGFIKDFILKVNLQKFPKIKTYSDN